MAKHPEIGKHRLLIVLTILNLAVGVFLAANMRAVEAQGVTPVIRTRMLELVDAAGRVRASIQIQPAGRTAKGEVYAETVILRLIDANGQPSVKLATSEQEAGLSIVGGDDDSYLVLKADTKESSLKLTNKTGKQQVFKP
jgi:hypothetical protein